MVVMNRIVWTLIGSLCVVDAFTTAPNRRSTGYYHAPTTTTCQLDTDGCNEKDTASSNNRRDLLASSLAAVAAVCLPSISSADDEPAPVLTKDGEGVIMYKTQSGLKYIELEAGNPSYKTPRYGQMCIITYTAYLKLPNAKEKEQFDSTSNFIIKHGNSKMIPGLDEGLHTMKVGGLRRVIIPPKLGFVASGLGPLPENPINRWKLNRLLENMITQKGGNLVYDVRLERVIDDEADQGYYEDEELSEEEMDELRKRLPATRPPEPQE
jgi:FKBP-type peptidyl-prolyl cis-trans isomerase